MGLKGRLDANQCLFPSVCLPDLALSSALEATSSFGFLLFILHLLNYSRFQGPHLFNAVITGGVGVLLSALYSGNTHFPHSTGHWLWEDRSAPPLPFLGANGVGSQATLSPTGTSLSSSCSRTALSHSWIHPSKPNILNQRCSHLRLHLSHWTHVIQPPSSPMEITDNFLKHRLRCNSMIPEAESLRKKNIPRLMRNRKNPLNWNKPEWICTGRSFLPPV